jgi:hypothetical protein
MNYVDRGYPAKAVILAGLALIAVGVVAEESLFLNERSFSRFSVIDAGPWIG